jgi:hypothetical protein
MSTDEALRRDVMANWDDKPAPQDIRFRPGQGGEMTPEWAGYMLNLWWSAKDKKLSFADAARLTVVHFVVGDQP